MTNSRHIVIHWFRRDLRLDDNTALWHALRSGFAVLPVFIFDTDILNDLRESKDRRLVFLHRELQRIKSVLEREYRSTLHVFHGKPGEVFRQLLTQYQVHAVFANEDYEPYAIRRDAEIAKILQDKGGTLFLFKDHVVFAKDEIVKADGTPYTVYTPYSRQWLAKLDDERIRTHMLSTYAHNYYRTRPVPFPHLRDLGFQDMPDITFPAMHVSGVLLKKYSEVRDMPAADGTSHLGVHLRFGTISIRKLVRQARETPMFLNELIWREFFQQILWHFPQVEDSCFRPQYENIVWRNSESDFKAWCEGMTGYPLVDAGMRELNATGFMHNRVRMVTASFLVKHLLIDWRWGEAYFAEKLLDYDLASNNGNWQWAAGTGCDAAPYFRIFNPAEQTRRFDPDGVYIRQWIPEFGKSNYPLPIVDHREARERALKVYSDAVKSPTN